MRPGAWARDGAVEWAVWAPEHERVELELREAGGPRRLVMQRDESGNHHCVVEGTGPGTRYRFVVGGEARPDPASRWQPDGVHGDSAVIEPAFEWSDADWVGRVIAEYVISEIHVGSFTDEGTFDAAITRLDDLAETGFTAVELMPVAEFPGRRNWGYDGVFPYAAQSSYGGPDGLRRFVDAAHARGLCVVLDVVYNHLGPEGNVLPCFGPYFTDRYRTPWGEAVNFDGPGSDEVRRFFIENALQWVSDFRIDALRLDAVHAIADPSAYPFVEELTDAVHVRAEQEGRHVWVIAESAANDARLITPREYGGIGCDAQWNDDFHHALHVLLTGERDEYYVDFGRVEDLATAFREGYVYAGRYSTFRRRRHGRSATGLPGQRFVVFAQNHDHVGNRAFGERLSNLVDDAALRVAAAAVVCAPFVPLFFMGEEYGETNPFPYFVDHTDPELVEAVRRGRREEFAELVAQADPPDPAAEETFASARLAWSRREEEPHASVLEWHRTLLGLRAERPALRGLDPSATLTQSFEDERALVVLREAADDVVAVVLAFSDAPASIRAALPPGTWRVLLDSCAGDIRAGDVVTSDGTIDLSLAPRCVLVLGWEEIV